MVWKLFFRDARVTLCKKDTVSLFKRGIWEAYEWLTVRVGQHEREFRDTGQVVRLWPCWTLPTCKYKERTPAWKDFAWICLRVQAFYMFCQQTVSNKAQVGQQFLHQGKAFHTQTVSRWIVLFPLPHYSTRCQGYVTSLSHVTGSVLSLCVLPELPWFSRGK